MAEQLTLAPEGPSDARVTQTAEEHGWVDARGVRHAPVGSRFSLRSLPDDALERRARYLRRAAEDGVSVPAAAHREVRNLQLVRFCLRMRYSAIDNHLGTDSYDRWYRLDAPPSYDLALQMDHTNWRLGRRHILGWPDSPSPDQHDQRGQG